jgi:16S rRNA (adenine1518-N6/adenine1519-N6)-dimethyltransferase
VNNTHTPRKRFGQNFLIDNNIIAAIVATIHPTPDQHILEIGPGLGVLTQHLIASKAKIDAVEIDRDLAQHLESRFSKCPNFTLHCQDILKFAIRDIKLRNKTTKLRVVGNLPYNISTPLLFKLFADIDLISDMFFMLQHEVALRLAAKPNTKEYGRMSIMAQYFCAMDIVINVPPSAFDPAPKVNSSVVRFVPHAQPTVKVTDHDLLQRLVTQAFSQRRKTIANALKASLTQNDFIALQIDPRLRPENLSLIDYANIANYLNVLQG